MRRFLAKTGAEVPVQVVWTVDAATAAKAQSLVNTGQQAIRMPGIASFTLIHANGDCIGHDVGKGKKVDTVAACNLLCRSTPGCKNFVYWSGVQGTKFAQYYQTCTTKTACTNFTAAGTRQGVMVYQISGATRAGPSSGVASLFPPPSSLPRDLPLS